MFKQQSDLKYYESMRPILDLQTYFSGPLKAWGIVQDFRGRIVQRLEIDMHGEWQGNKGILKEDIRYFDGRREQRTWHLQKDENGHFHGTADGIVGIAHGQSSGLATQWKYVMTIPVDGRDLNVTFDDWMFALNEDLVVNRAYMKKFGIKVAEVSIFIQKAAT